MSASAAAVHDTEGDLIVRREGSAGILRLNRPKAINALTLEMTRGIVTALDEFERDPKIAVVILEGAGERGLCAGGDIRGLYESSKAGGDLGPVFWREEYILNARIPEFPKPYVAYMDGLVMGGGVGLSAHGRHRIVNEKTKISMPEAGLGFFPDVGGTWLLANAPGEIGTYYALTGAPMNGADAIDAKAADVLIDSSSWPTLRESLTKAAPGIGDSGVDAILQKFSITPKSQIEHHRITIDRAFGHEAIEEIIAELERDESDFAKTTLKALSDKSPTSLKLTLKLLRMARQSKSLKECLNREYIAALAVFVSDEFREGVRAAIIDKDRNPKWSPSRVSDVTSQIVDQYFKPNPKYPPVFAAI
ncbi:MAG: enoyl-CoA hydratase/isomerase family protein [Pseudomonadota bacterium]